MGKGLGEIQWKYRSAWQLAIDETTNASAFATTDVSADSDGNPSLSLAGAAVIAFGEADAIAFQVGGTDAANEIGALTIGLLIPAYLSGTSGGIQGYKVQTVLAGTATLGADTVGTSLASLGSMASTDLIVDKFTASTHGGLTSNPYLEYTTNQADAENELVVRSRGAPFLIVHLAIATAASLFAFYRRLRVGEES